MVYLLGFLGDTDNIPDDLSGADWFEPGLFIFTFVITIVMVNILIGVLSESYDMHQDNADVIFGRERAEIVLSTSLRLWPRRELWHSFRWLQALVFIEVPDDWIGGHRD